MKAKELMDILEKNPDADIFIMVEKKPYPLGKGKIIRPKGSTKYPHGAFYFISRTYPADSIRPFRAKQEVGQEADQEK